MALFLLDSNYEIALKEFIVHRTDLFPSVQYGPTRIAQLFGNRQSVISEITQHVPIHSNILQKAQHYYALRNKLIHERATVGITDADVQNYRGTVQEVLTILYNLKFGE
jgi:hypothetical protein